jgi:hypothetical protein
MRLLTFVLSTLVLSIFAYSEETRTAPSPAATDSLAVFADGANCLFIGHSFFIPVAKSFNEIAGQNGFLKHQMDVVFAGGHAGSPGKLWDRRRKKKKIEEKLSRGKIDLLGMTAFSERNSSFEDYQNWIDLALQYNPNTSFFIGQPWTFGGPSKDHQKYDQSIESHGDRLFSVVTELRKSYPNTHIYFINYGKTASIMKSMYEEGELQDIEKISGRGEKALFRDRFMGHGGPMLLDLSALSWLNILYGAEIESLKHIGYDEADVKEILTRMTLYNGEFNSQ